MRNLMVLALGAAAVSFAVGAGAQKPIIYPAKGQSAQQQQQDDGACYSWARTNTGIDPAVVAQTPPPAPKPGGERLKGAARGAIVGEAVDNNLGGGAAAGAVV